jgi:hypothetical protein
VAGLAAAAELRAEPMRYRHHGGRLVIHLELPPHGVAAIEVEWKE